MKVVRHLVAVLFVVGVIVALGLAWKDTSAASIVSHVRHSTEGVKRLPPALAERLGSEHARRGRGGVQLGNVGILIRAVLLETVVGGVVVAIDATRRRRRRDRVRQRVAAATT